MIKLIQILSFFACLRCVSMLEIYLHKKEQTRAEEKFFILTYENAPIQWEKEKNIKMLRRASSGFYLPRFFFNLSRDINNQTFLYSSVSFYDETKGKR